MSEAKKKEPAIKVETEDDLFRLMCIAKGIDPKQVQAMSKFSDFDNNDERSFYPDKLTVLAIAQLRMFGEALYKGDEWNEYTSIADKLSVGFMGYKGFKSGQYVDITSGQINLDKLKGVPEEVKKGVLQGIFNRSKSE